jgi:hypothetical protein
MIFIQNKKAWKEFVKDLDAEWSVPAPREYPCYAESKLSFDSVRVSHYIQYCYLADLQRMVAAIEKGKEF